MEYTLGIIKPDAFSQKEEITKMIAGAGLTIVEHKEIQLTTEQAQAFYEEHSARPFYNDLCNFIVSGPVLIMKISGDNAILRFRELIGATNPLEAKDGTIRKKYGKNIDNNAVHGSDSTASSTRELKMLFA